MEALEIEGQTNQTPLARRGPDPTQGELAEAEHLLDDADHGFDRAFACAVNGFAQRGSQLVGHLEPLSWRPPAAGQVVARSAGANWDDGDHAPSQYRVRCRASHTPKASRGRCTRRPARRPRACRARTGWPPE